MTGQRSGLGDVLPEEELTAEEMEYIKKMQSEIFGMGDHENGAEMQAKMMGMSTQDNLKDLFSRLDEE